MISSIFGVAKSGIRAHNLRLSVSGNNLANISTPGFKRQYAAFSEHVSPLGRRGRGDGGGVGVFATGIARDFQVSGWRNTGRPADLALIGKGFFSLEDPRSGDHYYTRLGSFSLSDSGHLEDLATGFHVLDESGSPLRLSQPTRIAGEATTSISIGGTLESSAEDGDSASIEMEIFDSLGRSHVLILTFTKQAEPGAWTLTGSVPSTDSTLQGFSRDSISGVTFNTDGSFAGLSGGGTAELVLGFEGAASPQTITIDLSGAGTLGGLSQTGESSALLPLSVDGAGPGELLSHRILDSGTILATYSNGKTAEEGRLGIAMFRNPEGLAESGWGTFVSSEASGDAEIAGPGEGARGTVLSGALEDSNVELTEELMEVMIAQRGFQANARIIKVADSLYEEALNLLI